MARRPVVTKQSAVSNPATTRIEHPSSREVIFSRLLDAPRELVWKVWSDPQQLPALQ